MKNASAPIDQPHGHSAWVWMLTVLLVAMWPCASVASEPTSSATNETVTRVVVALDPRVAELDAASMIAALQGHLPGMLPQVEVRPVLGSEHEAWVETRLARQETRAVVSIGRADDMGLSIVLQLPGDGGSWARRIPAADDPAVLLEQIGAMLGGMLGVEPTIAEPAPSSPPSAPPPAPTPPPPPPRVIDLWVGYMGEPLAPTAPWTHGIAVESSIQMRRDGLVGVGLGWTPPHQVSTTDGVRVQRIPVRLTGGYRFSRGRRFQPAVFATATIEALGWSPAVGDTIVGRGGWAARAGAGAGFEGRLRLGRGVVAFARATGQAWLLNGTIVVVQPSNSRTIFRGYPVSGVAMLGVGYAWMR